MPLSVAARSPAFWVHTLAATLFDFTFSALTLDSEALLSEHGLDDPRVNEVVLGVLMFSGLPTNILAGRLARRLPMGKLLAVGVAALAASLLVFPSVTSTGAAVGYGTLLGGGGGIITVIYFAVYGHTYGRGHLGSIQAAVQVRSVLASATGPVALAACRASAGLTAPFFYTSAGASAVPSALAWFGRPAVLTRGRADDVLAHGNRAGARAAAGGVETGGR